MKIDLAAAAAKSNATTGEVRAVWSGGKIEIDEVKFLDLVARAIAVAMGLNLFNGLRTDGSGPMPARKSDAEPRGKGSKISRALAPIKQAGLVWIIAAHRENIGHVARIMRGIPFAAPPIEKIRAAVHQAFLLAVQLGEATAAQRALPAAARGKAGSVARQARREARAFTAGVRGEFQTAVGDLGVGLKSGLSKRIRSAGRAQIRLGRR